MTKFETAAEHVVVTFFEAATAYITINQTNLSGNIKWTAIGALGAGLSALYNLIRQSTPPVSSAEPTIVAPTVAIPDPTPEAPEPTEAGVNNEATLNQPIN